MNYEVHFSKEFERIFEKLQKKDRKQSEIILKKVRQIRDNPEHFKPLRHDLKSYKRVHIGKSFILIYKIEGNKVIIQDYDHHKKIYKKKY